jgi:hypothetical protein
MTENQYETLASLVSRIRNAKFSDMVLHLEQLIDSGIWRDFTTPRGTHFTFRACEFDYFLAAQDVDPVTVKYAYMKAEGIEDLARKETRLADITGAGVTPGNGDRRTRDEVARLYAGDPSGAGARIKARSAVVTPRLAGVAKDAQRRKEYEATGKGRDRPNSKCWRVRWSGETPAAKVIADALLREPDLAHEVYKVLDAERVRTAREQNHRSEA